MACMPQMVGKTKIVHLKLNTYWKVHIFYCVVIEFSWFPSGKSCDSVKVPLVATTMSTQSKYESFVVSIPTWFSSLNPRKSNLAEDRNSDRFWSPLCSYHPCLWRSQGDCQNFQFRQEGAFCLMESINVRHVFSRLRNLKEDWNAVRAPKVDDNLYYGLYERCGLASQLICCYFFLDPMAAKLTNQ